MGNGPALPHVSGQLQNMQISPQLGTNGPMMTDAAMMMDPMMVQMNMGPVGTLDPQLQPGDPGPPQYSLPPMGPSPVALPRPPPMYQSDYSGSSILTSGTSLTEFTKRRNWSQRLLEELQDWLHILTPEMKIVYSSPAAKILLGWETEELLGQPITEFIHDDDAGVYVP